MKLQDKIKTFSLCFSLFYIIKALINQSNHTEQQIDDLRIERVGYNFERYAKFSAVSQLPPPGGQPRDGKSPSSIQGAGEGGGGGDADPGSRAGDGDSPEEGEINRGG